MRLAPYAIVLANVDQVCARGYCLRGLTLNHPHITQQTIVDDPAVLDVTSVQDVPFLYWTGAAWGAELSLADDRLKRIGELAAVRALLERAKSLDEAWELCAGVAHRWAVSATRRPFTV